LAFPMSRPVWKSFYGRPALRVHYGCLADWEHDMQEVTDE
jgi:hypothetical protein